MAATENKLTPKQSLFVKEYLVDLNATQAAIRAGYSKKTAGSVGQENLTKPEIQAALKAAMVERSRRTEITADRVLKEYARIAFFDARKLFREDGSPLPITELDDATAAAIVGLDVSEIYAGETAIGQVKKYKLADKKGALDSIARHLGMFKDKIEVTGKEGAPLFPTSIELVSPDVSGQD